MDRRKFVGAVASNLLAAPLAAFGQTKAKVPRRSIKAAGSLSMLAAGTVLEFGPYANTSVTGGYNIIDYSGMTYDPIGKRMLIFGGGHGPSNETDIRSLDLSTLAWSSLYPSMPYSDMTLANCDSDRGRWISTNHPFARHSYNETLVVGRRFYMMCFQGMPYINGVAEPQWGGRICWYDFDTGAWTYSKNTRAQTPWHFASAAALDPVSGKIVVVGMDAYYQSFLWFYDPGTDTIATGPKLTSGVGLSLDLIYVPDNDRFYAISQLNGKVSEIALNRANLNLSSATALAVSANLPGYTGDAPSGYAYDPVNKIIGGFVVKGVFSAFDPFAKTWTQKQMIDAATGSAASTSQTFYCMEFDPASGCFIFLGNAGSLKGRTFAYRYSPATAGVGRGPGPSNANYEGLWWNAPGGSESGWGINFAHQGDVIFATWFTYDLAGNAWWLSMKADRMADDTYSGTLYETHGPAFNAVPFDPELVSLAALGSGTLTFSDEANGTFDYTVKGYSQTKTIRRDAFANPVPNCTFDATTDPALATNYQDIWWAYPPGSESGWGVNLTHQGDIIYATWFTYNFDGSPLWLSVAAAKMSTGVYAGTLNRTTGPAFNAAPFDPAAVSVNAVGTAKFTFVDGNTGYFDYTLSNVTQAKRITRTVFQAPTTICA